MKLLDKLFGRARSRQVSTWEPMAMPFDVTTENDVIVYEATTHAEARALAERDGHKVLGVCYSQAAVYSVRLPTMPADDEEGWADRVIHSGGRSR